MRTPKRNSASSENQPLLSTEALQDLKGIQSYIADEQESPQNALKVIESIISRIEGLLHFPDTGTLLAPKVDFETNYRYAKASGYLIFYRHEKGGIFVDRIIHGRRDYITILDPSADKD
ncbi:MAG: type II toxin-antitoxin system RelE/ParE family toxin [Treponema sp.]|nr:type II toxin-antitoxin system RelE/ParE family toxin [Treponema sp.]